jgi:hypothetical protein
MKRCAIKRCDATIAVLAEHPEFKQAMQYAAQSQHGTP